MTSPFDLFGLDQDTASLEDLKRAYAARLKVTRPEDDPKAFMALRQAFEDAKRVLTYRPSPNIEPPAQIPEHAKAPAGERDQTLHTRPFNHDFTPRTAPTAAFETPLTGSAVTFDAAPTIDPVTAAISDIQALTTKTKQAQGWANWEAILLRDDLFEIDHFAELSYHLRDWLCDVTGAYTPDRTIHLPQWLSIQTFKGLCEHFGWPQPAQNDQQGLREAAWLAEVDRDLTRLSDKHGLLSEDTTGRKLGDVMAAAGRSGGQVIKDGKQSGSGPSVWFIIFAVIAVMNFVRLCEDSSPSYQNFEYDPERMERLFEHRREGSVEPYIIIRETTEAEREQAQRDQKIQDLIERADRARRNQQTPPPETETQTIPSNNEEQARKE